MADGTTPSISVALCTYNGARYVREQLESVAAQSLLPTEIVACDDASVDDTVEILEAFARHTSFPMQVHRNATNLGVSKNFEQALRLCTGDFISLADQDDIWLSDKLAALHEAVLARSNAAYAFSDARLIDEAGHEIGGKSLLARRFARPSIAGKFAGRRELDLLLKRDFVYGTTLLLSAEGRDLCLPMAAGWSHDTWIVNVLACFGLPGVPVLKPHVLYRQHGVQASGGMGDPHRTTHAERFRAYEALRRFLQDRSSETKRPLVAGVLDRIEEKLMYLRALRDMQSMPLTRRATTAAGEVISGRWWRYTPRTFLVDKRFDLAQMRDSRS